jgi:hypothetical protein
MLSGCPLLMQRMLNVYAHDRTFQKSVFQKIRDSAHSLFHAFYFQVFVAILLLANFLINAAEAQMYM